MPQEIERKFLVTSPGFKLGARSTRYRQGYLVTDPRRSVRVRVGGGEAFVTIKGPTSGATRQEYEYPIPVAHAAEILERLALAPVIDKTRHVLEVDGLVWEVDEFHGENEGLVIAEVELHSEDQPITLPEWVGEEVTSDARYFNQSLVENPYSSWK
jgi:adenylate cyclase